MTVRTTLRQDPSYSSIQRTLVRSTQKPSSCAFLQGLLLFYPMRVVRVGQLRECAKYMIDGSYYPPLGETNNTRSVQAVHYDLTDSI